MPRISDRTLARVAMEWGRIANDKHHPEFETGQLITDLCFDLREARSGGFNMDTAPNGWDEIVQFYTLPDRDETGHITQAWKDKHLFAITAPFPLDLAWGGTATKILCHNRVGGPLIAALEEVQAQGFATYLAKDYGGCFADRAIRGKPTHISLHAFGAAIDFRTPENPLGGLGEHQMENLIAPIFKKHGFTWGGDFKSRLDPQHFQFGSGY